MHEAKDDRARRDGELPGFGTTMTEPLLDVRELRTEFRTDEGVVRAVDGVSF